MLRAESVEPMGRDTERVAQRQRVRNGAVVTVTQHVYDVHCEGGCGLKLGELAFDQAARPEFVFNQGLACAACAPAIIAAREAQAEGGE